MSDEQYLSDPYNEQEAPLGFQTPPDYHIIQKAINNALLVTHTCQPAVVTKVLNASYVNIQPMFKRTYVDGSTINLPEIQNVPIACLSGDDYWIKPPIAVGDYGLAIFAERSLDIWQEAAGGGQPVDPVDVRHHDLTDAFFLPGVRPMNNLIPVGNAEDMVIHNGKSDIILQKDGKFKFSNESFELLSTLNQLVEDLISAMVITGIGPQPFMPTTVTALQQVKTKIQSLMGE